MGWSSCGEDDRGRPIGYGHEGTCDHPGCEAKIDRGLSYACGGMHGHSEWSCDAYFCGEHLWFVNAPDELDITNGLCAVCLHLYQSAHPDCDECGGWGKYLFAGQDNSDAPPCNVCNQHGVLKSEIEWSQSEAYEDNGLTMHDWAVYEIHPDIEDSTCKCGAGKGEPCVGRDEDGGFVVLPMSRIHVDRRAA
jgi:hypothetical protein